MQVRYRLSRAAKYMKVLDEELELFSFLETGCFSTKLQLIAFYFKPWSNKLSFAVGRTETSSFPSKQLCFSQGVRVHKFRYKFETLVNNKSKQMDRFPKWHATTQGTRHHQIRIITVNSNHRIYFGLTEISRERIVTS